MNKISKMLLLVGTSLVLTACDFFSFTTTLVSKITLDETRVELDKGETKQLTATVKPITASNKNIEWTTSDSTICSVTETGKVTAVEYGIATIRATAVDGSNAFAECVFDIKEEGAVLSSIEVVDPDNAFQTGDEFRKSKVVAHYIGGSSRVVTDAATFSGYNLYQAGICTVNVSYTENSVTKQTSYEITVEESGLDSGKTLLKQSYEDYAHNNISNIDFTPTIGEPNLLVIPVWFTDSNSYIKTEAKKEAVRTDIRKAYFGDETDTGWESVRSYYYEESHGLVNMKGTVSEWYEVGSSHINYASNSNATTQLVTTATDWYFNNHASDNRKNYDTNGDGRLDGVMLIYAYPNYVTLNSEYKSNLWAYCYWIQTNSPNKSRPTPNVFFWASYDFMYSEAKAYEKTGSYVGYGDTSNCSIDTHTFIHEMGHCFGLEDYYDYSEQYKPAGDLTMQDCNVGGHDPYSTLALGWTKPYIPTASVTLKLKPFQSSGDIILLTPSWNSYDSPFDEYLLIEYYTPSGLNKFDSMHQYGSRNRLPTTSGIRLWHVDARLAYSNYRGEYSINQLTTNANYTSHITHAFSNTYYSSELEEGYYSPIGTFTIGSYTVDACDFNILHYIRNSKVEPAKPVDVIDNYNMFTKGSTFTMQSYSSQFLCGNRLNSTKELGWSFKVANITSTEATIELTKAE